ncbi:MAG: hypothetical protein IJP92_16130 [Lachnospiraceae bacterium]|nr:hypothetical protein [Lachnospiraceae bacterium]
MKAKRIGSEQRRAMNQIWNAAGRYDFDAPFMAFRPDGSADFYFNTVIGLTEKWLGAEALTTFFASYAHSPRAEHYDTLLWLGIEHCLYEKEIGERPMLASLRRAYAEQFMQQEQTLSRQEMMAQMPRVYEQQQIRWGEVLERPVRAVGSAAKLAEALRIPGSVETKELIDRLKLILVDYFRFRGFRLTEHDGIPISAQLGSLLRNVMRRDSKQHDSLVVRGVGTSAESRAPFGSTRQLAKSEEDEDYIRNCFGGCLYDASQMQLLENALCTDAHEECRLWYAPAEPDPVPEELLHKEAKQLAADIKKQHARNVAFYNKSSVLIAAGIRALSAQLDAILSTYLQPLPERSRAGDLTASKAYRLKLLHDPYVFTRPGDEVENNLSVDILLDASSSRASAQEIIAAQAYILAKSLIRCHVPVQVSAFRSVKGFTVTQRLKSYTETDVNRIFRYYASGWNRDGLAVRAVEKLTEKGGEKKLLLVLTDAHPNDSQKMPPEEGSIFTREYDSVAAVDDTIEAVRELREKGIMIGAIFTGKTSYLENLHAIYGKYYVRIRKTEQLAVGAGTLLTQMLRELRN